MVQQASNKHVTFDGLRDGLTELRGADIFDAVERARLAVLTKTPAWHQQLQTASVALRGGSMCRTRYRKAAASRRNFCRAPRQPKYDASDESAGWQAHGAAGRNPSVRLRVERSRMP